MNLHRYQGFLKSTVNGRPLPPTTFNLPKPLDRIFPENRETVVNQTVRDLCRPKDDVHHEQKDFAFKTELIMPRSESHLEKEELCSSTNDEFRTVPLENQA